MSEAMASLAAAIVAAIASAFGLTGTPAEHHPVVGSPGTPTHNGEPIEFVDFRVWRCVIERDGVLYSMVYGGPPLHDPDAACVEVDEY